MTCRHAELVMGQCTHHLQDQNPSKTCCVVSRQSQRLPAPEVDCPEPSSVVACAECCKSVPVLCITAVLSVQ